MLDKIYKTKREKDVMHEMKSDISIFIAMMPI